MSSSPMTKTSTPIIPSSNALEISNLGTNALEKSPTDVDAKGRRPIKLGSREETIALLALYGSMFLAGWNDATIGPLLLRMQSHYNLTYTIVSLVFVFNFVGFMAAALINVWITHRLGFGLVICLGGLLQIVAYCLQCWAPPFPVFCFAMVLNGGGIGLQDAQANTFVSRMPNMMPKMSILHAVYGVGALVCPLVATQFATLERWSYHYLCSLGLALITCSINAYVFQFRSEPSLLGADVFSAPSLDGPTTDVKKLPSLWEILKKPVVHLFAGFVLIYVGTEVTIGGWIVTYIVEVRGGGPSAGYTSSGFFAGLTLGRIIFIPLTRSLGENLSIYIYTLAALALQFVVWFVPDLVGNAVAVSFVGVMIGPHYPIVMSAATKLLPGTHIGGAIGWIASFGQAGSAVFPFIVGAISQKHGLEALNPVVVSMLGALVLIWLATPRVPKALD